MDPESTAVAIAWYRPEQWSLLRAVSSDGDELELTFEEWVGNAEQKQKELEAEGFVVQRVVVDLTELTRWCIAKGCPVDGKARVDFALYKGNAGQSNVEEQAP